MKFNEVFEELKKNVDDPAKGGDLDAEQLAELRDDVDSHLETMVDAQNEAEGDDETVGEEG